MTPPLLAGGADIFAVLAEHDVLVHHPYESFAASVEAFVAAAAEDPDVLAIKQTLYRTGDDSPIVAALVRASQAGKQVTAVVELQARFDEQTNIGWARTLEEAGVQVIYGLVTLKTHSKISLVVRREGERDPPLLPHRQRQLQLGDGPDLRGRRAAHRRPRHRRRRRRAVQHAHRFGAIRRPSAAWWSPRSRPGPTCWRPSTRRPPPGRSGRIVLKTNGLTDPGIIDALYRASQAGASVDLIVRGRCCLRPGVPGLSEAIRVRSIVGRYLEHSRIFRFGGVDGRPLRMSIGSPDMMERNLDRRVEVIVPIDDPGIQHRLVGHPRRRPARRGQLVDPARRRAVDPGGAGRAAPRASGSTCRITAKRRLSNPSGLGAVRDPEPHLRPRRRHRRRQPTLVPAAATPAAGWTSPLVAVGDR